MSCIKNALVVLCAIICLSFQTKAQVSVSNTRLFLQPVTPINTDFPGADSIQNLLSLAPEINYRLCFKINTMLDVEKIHVKLGSAAGGSQIVQTFFGADGTASSPYTMVLDEDVVDLSLGVHGFYNTVFIEVKIEYADGTFSPPFNTIN
jgi:hypothetical protein